MTTKQELLKQHPELIKEIAWEMFQQWKPTKSGPFSNYIEEYIEEQTKPGWEILSFKAVREDKISTLKSNGCYLMGDCLPESEYAGATLDDMMTYLENGERIIHSIKRTSDGEVFTVGDKVQNPGRRVWEIGSIKYENGVLVVYCTVNGRCPDIDKLQKAGQPLFTTEDGVQLFGDEKVHWVICNHAGKWGYSYELGICESHFGEKGCVTANPDIYKLFADKDKAMQWIEANNPKPLFTTEDGMEVYKGDQIFSAATWKVIPHTAFANEWGNSKHNYSPLFSTKEAAEEYILMNKPVLSITDLADKIDDYRIMEELRELVKSRL